MHASCMLLLLRFPHTWMDSRKPAVGLRPHFPLAGWMPLAGPPRWLRPSQGNVPAEDWIIPETCSIALRDGEVPEGRGLRSDSMHQDLARVLLWLIY
jgi:hypothetical protein